MEAYKKQTQKSVKSFLDHQTTFPDCISALDAALVRFIKRREPGDIGCRLPSLARSHHGHFPIRLTPLLPARQQHLIAPVSALAPYNPIVEANHATDYAVNANFIARLWIDSGIAGGHNNLSFLLYSTYCVRPFRLSKSSRRPSYCE